MVELVDTHALGACANRLAGSTPVAGTIDKKDAGRAYFCCSCFNVYAIMGL